MELTLIQFDKNTSDFFIRGFNPCFNGTYSYTKIREIGLNSTAKFQSLF